MSEAGNVEFRLRYDGDFIDGKSISIRTLGHTLPHFQRAIDKAVLFDQEGKYKRGRGITRADYFKADLSLEFFEEGSVILPLKGFITEGTAKFFNWALRKPHNEAKDGGVGLNREAQIATYKKRMEFGDLEAVTQKDLLERSKQEDRKYARSAMLNDLDKMFSVLRTSGEHRIDIQLAKPGHQAVYDFNKNTAKNFNKLVSTALPTEPVVYKGRYKGYKEINNGASFEIYIHSTYSGQTVNVYVSSMNELDKITKYPHGTEIMFWASPLQRYGAFDAYNGSAIFVGLY
ncbi:hypothetical protein ACUN8C_10520 [Kushneria sp. Sum13]|uniref:hypothetical protein n=1 Tax=Kushneria sp. Sum13 TaxID=3459196 RepID=UPI00404670D1